MIAFSRFDMLEQPEEQYAPEIEAAFAKLPAILCKAACDRWRYGLRLQTGETFIFSAIGITDQNWITLHEVEMVDPLFPEMKFTRRFEVPIADIRWAWEVDS